MDCYDFNCDRQAKNDFTASTVAYGKEKDVEGDFSFYEQDKSGDFVPFGSSAASTTSHYDLWAGFSTPKGIQRYIFELKERRCSSKRYATAFINEEKWPGFLPYIQNGWKVIWAELYTDGVIRIWDLTKVDFEKLPLSKRYIKRKTVDPNSPREIQWRREIPMEWGIIISRING